MLSNKIKQLHTQFEDLNLIKIFEIPVINNKTNEPDHVIFDIEPRGTYFVATHEATTQREDKSKKIAFCRTKIDADFSLDHNLEELHSECIQKIIDSEFFTLSE